MKATLQRLAEQKISEEWVDLTRSNSKFDVHCVVQVSPWLLDCLAQRPRSGYELLYIIAALPSRLQWNKLSSNEWISILEQRKRCPLIFHLRWLSNKKQRGHYDLLWFLHLSTLEQTDICPILLVATTAVRHADILLMFLSKKTTSCGTARDLLVAKLLPLVASEVAKNIFSREEMLIMLPSKGSS